MKLLISLLFLIVSSGWAQAQSSLAREALVHSDPSTFHEDHSPANDQSSYIPGVLADTSVAHTDSFEGQNQYKPFTLALCVTPKVAIDCCNYTFRDGNPAKDVNYRSIKEVYGSEADSRTFAGDQIPRMPFFLPYAGDDASLGQGWLYESGDSHASLDFSKTKVDDGTDPAFKVLAAASGKVVSKVWDNWHGNVLTIEHTAANGTKYRTLYFHLRNGKAADLAAARAIVPPDPNVVDQWVKYSRFANLKSPSDLHWGTESQKILVKVGDWVNAGQLIAYSGNTGVGGASAGLKDDGTPFNSTRANNHLHFMLAVQNPKTAGGWVFIDSFGVYEKASTGCTDLMKENQYSRYFAPFYSSFHGISSDLFFKYFPYYSNMNMGLQTMSMYWEGGALKVAGAWDSSVQGPWLARGFMTTNDFNTFFNQHGGEGFRPRELTVTLDGQGQPRFSAIWKKRGNEAYAVWINMSDAFFDGKWKDLVVNQKYRIEDYVAYHVGGQRLSAAIFVKDNMPFYLFTGFNSQQYDAKFQELLRQGFANTSFNAVLPNGDRYSGVWTKPGGHGQLITI